MAQISEQIENIPGYDIVMEGFNTYADDHLSTKDPFYVKENGEEVRRKAPQGITKEEKKIWKHIINKAWTHDRCFCGCTGGLDIGLGSAPLVALIPVIGPLVMYGVHGRIVSIAEEARIPAKLHAKMTANITFDFLISLIPVLGAFFEWMNACSTRNAALFDTYLRNRGATTMERLGPFQLEDRGAAAGQVSGQQTGTYS